MNALFVILFISLCGITNALRIPVVSRSNARPVHQRQDGLFNSGAGVMMYSTHVTPDIQNAKDVVYATNITLGGQEFPIQLDTGSSDVWVMPPVSVQPTNTTTIQTNLTFGIGEVQGTIQFADMTLGPYEVRSQAFLNATNATNFDAIFSNGIFGILGLAFDQGSTVFIETLLSFGKGTTQGRTFLGNVYAQDINSPNFFTVLLGRGDDPLAEEQGVFTISEYNDALGDIVDQPELLRTPAQTADPTQQPRWSVQMDAMTVNGIPFQFNQTSVPEADPTTQVVVLDTGFTFSQIPPAAVDFIYQSIPGAVFNQTTGLYDVPCGASADLEFQFGGMPFPIHPLDLTVVKQDGNNVVCNNAYRALNLPPGVAAGFDAILGVSFLKNAYVSFDFGDWTPDNATNGVPFVQMLSMTDPVLAMEEFITVRCQQITNILTPPLPGTSLSPTADNSAADPTAVGSLSLSQNFLGNSSSVLSRRADVDAVIQLDNKNKNITTPSQRTVIFVKTSWKFPMPGLKVPTIPLARHVHACTEAVLVSYGPAVLSLLVGILFLVLIATVVGIFVAVHIWLHNMAATIEADMQLAEEGYGPIYVKLEDGEVLFDESYQDEV